MNVLSWVPWAPDLSRPDAGISTRLDVVSSRNDDDPGVDPLPSMQFLRPHVAHFLPSLGDIIDGFKKESLTQTDALGLMAVHFGDVFHSTVAIGSAPSGRTILVVCLDADAQAEIDGLANRWRFQDMHMTLVTSYTAGWLPGIGAEWVAAYTRYGMIVLDLDTTYGVELPLK